jgi:hypothetical protein
MQAKAGTDPATNRQWADIEKVMEYCQQMDQVYYDRGLPIANASAKVNPPPKRSYSANRPSSSAAFSPVKGKGGKKQRSTNPNDVFDYPDRAVMTREQSGRVYHHQLCLKCLRRGHTVKECTNARVGSIEATETILGKLPRGDGGGISSGGRGGGRGGGNKGGRR